MTEDVENIIIEHLKALRSDLREFRQISIDQIVQRIDRIERRLELS